LLRRAARIARLVDEVGEIGAGEARRLTGDGLDLDLLVERLALRMDLEDRGAALHVRAVEDDLAVEPARAQERRSRTSGRLVAATTITFVFVSKPSSRRGSG